MGECNAWDGWLKKANMPRSLPTESQGYYVMVCGG
jgi:hypothetical protein